MSEASRDVADALKLVLLFFTGGKWPVASKKEWIRITGDDKATTKVLCDHVRMVLDAITRPRPGRPRNKDKTFEATKPWAAEGVSRATWYNRRRREKAEVRPE